MPSSRSLYTTPLLTLLVILTAGYLLSSDSEGATITVDTDWVVDTSEDVNVDNTYIMKANLTVTATGQISFRRCKFEFMSEYPGDYGIIVQPGGYLTLHTCTLKAGLLSPRVLAEAWTFHVLDAGRLSLQASHILDLGVLGGVETERGLAIESDNVMVSGTIFEECNRGLVILSGASPEILDNTFSESQAGIEVKGSAFHLASFNTFIDNAAGIIFQEVGNGFLGAGEFINSGHCVRAVMSTVRVENVTTIGDGIAFSSEGDSYMVVENSTVQTRDGRGNAKFNSNLHFINCESPGWLVFTDTDANSHITVKQSVHFKVAYDGADYPVNGADVELRDKLGDKVYQQVTGSDGLSPVRLVTVFEHHGSLDPVPHQPFSAIASAGYNYEEKMDINLGPDHIIEVIFVDDVSPDLTVQLPADGASYNFSEVMFRGWLKDLNSGISAFYYTVNGGLNNSLTIQDPWQERVYLPEGDLIIDFVAVDLVGNEAVVTRSVTVDFTPPGAIDLDPASGSMTRAFQLLVNGTTEVGATLKVQGNDWTVGPDGSFSGYITLDDSEGEQTIKLRLTDAAGNEGVVNYLVVVDRTAPPLTVETDPDHRDFPFVNRSRILVFGDTEPGATVKVHANSELLNETVANELGKWSMGIQLVLGENDLLVDVWDPAGNRATVEIIDFWYDVTPPEITLIEPIDGAIYKYDIKTILVKVRTEPEAVVWVNDETEKVQPVHGELEFPEVEIPYEGNNTITVYVRDQAGNLATRSIVVVRKEKEENNGGPTEGIPVWLVALVLAIVVVVALVVHRFVLKRQQGT